MIQLTWPETVLIVAALLATGAGLREGWLWLLAEADREDERENYAELYDQDRDGGTA